jgi:hypothetical protein
MNNATLGFCYEATPLKLVIEGQVTPGYLSFVFLGSISVGMGLTARVVMYYNTLFKYVY